MQLFIDGSQLNYGNLATPQQFSAGATTCTSIDTGNNGEVLGNMLISVGAMGGTNPTVTVQVYQADDNATFTAITGAVNTAITASGQVWVPFLWSQRYLQVIVTIGGTAGPTAYANVDFLSQAKSSNKASGFSNFPAAAYTP